MGALKINERNWKQTRSIIVTTKGLYNFNKKKFRRFVPSTLVEGIIISTSSFELIVHVP